MTLVKCPECGKDISDLTPACVECGRPMHPQSNPIQAYIDNLGTLWSEMFSLFNYRASRIAVFCIYAFVIGIAFTSMMGTVLLVICTVASWPLVPRRSDIQGRMSDSYALWLMWRCAVVASFLAMLFNLMAS
jgi:hypothetical protein